MFVNNNNNNNISNHHHNHHHEQLLVVTVIKMFVESEDNRLNSDSEKQSEQQTLIFTLEQKNKIRIRRKPVSFIIFL